MNRRGEVIRPRKPGTIGDAAHSPLPETSALGLLVREVHDDEPHTNLGHVDMQQVVDAETVIEQMTGAMHGGLKGPLTIYLVDFVSLGCTTEVGRAGPAAVAQGAQPSFTSRQRLQQFDPIPKRVIHIDAVITA
jgi:hypothetical protein